MFAEQNTNGQNSSNNPNEINSMTRKPRQKRQKIDFFVEPLSPCSSSSSQTIDCNFEPTIDMMVNDFDDEQTLENEEKLAALEDHDPTDEIQTLKEESEMPLEELLAKYQSLPPVEIIHRKKKRSKPTCKENVGPTLTKDNSSTNVRKKEEDVSAVGDEEEEDLQPNVSKTNSDSDNSNVATVLDDVVQSDAISLKRSHLIDLYPEQSYIMLGGEQEKDRELSSIDGEEGESDCDEETEEDIVKKTIMVGTAYQAVIPEGLSQYGDILPYENEDKLIWEPSQVSEREVEEYLLDARNIKPSSKDEELIATEDQNQLNSKTLTSHEQNNNPLSKSESKPTPPSVAKFNENDTSGVIKDNEQALHLLVLCGYDFKEALRRKRLNALPLTDSMSLWSEEECQKFEEGIKEHGKDFVKIRQNQVRTRTMRELVQFYYLWKKSERRDQNFANADTVDHMDIYLNESGDYGTSAATIPSGSTIQVPMYATKKSHSFIQKNLSILAGNGTNNAAKCAASLNISSNKYYNNNKQNDSLNLVNQ